MSTKSKEYTINYRNMRGVDFSQSDSEGKIKRYAYAENMYRDYDAEGGALIESVPGFRRLYTFDGRINGIFPHKNSNGEDFTVVHAGNKVYRFMTSNRDTLIGTQISPITEMLDTKSSAFRFGGSLYVIDGNEILKISDSDTVKKVTPESDAVYVPTTFYNGERIEQRNLLTDRFCEKYLVGAIDTVIYGTHGLLYRITSEELGLCAVIGIKDFYGGIVNIPSYVKIGKKKYKVDEVADHAFYQQEAIEGVKIGPGVRRIGKYAFAECKRLYILTINEAPTLIDDYAFKNCSSLTLVYLGIKLEKIGEGAFEGTNQLNIKFSSAKEDFYKIENSESLNIFQVFAFEYDFSTVIEIPVCTPAIEISSVKINGVTENSYTPIVENGITTAILITVTDRRDIEGKEVVIEARASDSVEDSSDGIKDFLHDTGYSGTCFEAICGCRLCESFDGRIFLSGNPALPGTVFFSSFENGRGALLYFGAYNYFSDGLGTYGISSMLSCADSLLVFKSADDGGGSIFYHTPHATGNDIIPKIYPVTYTHNGIGGLGRSISFFDDPIFISKAGVSAIDKKTINLERSIACRSHNVNAKLLSEDLASASLAEWCGYLALGLNGSIYLADSRATFLHESGYREYEWFYLSGVGVYKNAQQVYRYSSTAHKGYYVHKNPEEIPDKTIQGIIVNGEFIYYVTENGKRYEVYSTDEKSGGDFYPLTYMTGFENDLLFFGTDNGDVCLFNNDKRGIAPPSIMNAADFDENEYKKVYGRRIHPYYYTFDTQKMRCGVRTLSDDCGSPSITKNTVKHSLVLKCRLGGSGRIKCEAKTNRSSYAEYSAFPNDTVDFSDFSFATLTLNSDESVSLPISEKEKNWIEKEISIYCDDFRSPIGVYSLTYRYTYKGRIKHN